MSDLEDKSCIRCLEACKEWEEEFLYCTKCKSYVHLTCLANGHVPGDLLGDVFYTYICYDCTDNGREVFRRTNVSWLEAIVLTLQNLQTNWPNLAKKGYFHYKLHIAAFLERHSTLIFGNDFKPEQAWHELVADILFLYCPPFFTSGREVLNEPGWWTLSYPTLTPSCIGKLNAELNIKKREVGDDIEDEDLLRKIIGTKPFSNVLFVSPSSVSGKKRRAWEVTEEERGTTESDFNSYCSSVTKYKTPIDEHVPSKKLKVPSPVFYKLTKFLNPYCLYDNASCIDSVAEIKLIGSVREAHICSPHTGRVVKPYIFIIPTINPPWLKLMDQIKRKHNSKQNEEQVLLQRKTFNFAYLQPELVPAINALCNQFLWTGIDVSPALEYPDFTCVVLYGKLIVAFGIIIPDTAHAQSYLPFIFTRPYWRNSGIGRYMIYHLCQANRPRDVTVHVSKNSNSVFLFNKFHFIRERVDKNFYTKYNRFDKTESDDAFYFSLKT